MVVFGIQTVWSLHRQMDSYDDEVMRVIDDINQVNVDDYLQNVNLVELLGDEKRKYSVKQRIDPFEIYDEPEFARRYRFSKEFVHELFAMIDGPNNLEPFVCFLLHYKLKQLEITIYLTKYILIYKQQVIRDGFTIPGIHKLLIALRYYAVGCFLEPLSDMFGISKSSACDIVSEVSYLICHKLRNQFIVMPENEREILEAKAMFSRVDGFPLIVGAIDGTHMRVQSFGGDTAELYRNRKTYFSLNCQLTVSANVS